jgi:hypothetical protein
MIFFDITEKCDKFAKRKIHQKMLISVITGDITNSKRIPTEVWQKPLIEELKTIGATPKQWEIFRGDSFQVEIDKPEEALMSAIKIKAALRSVQKYVDVRMAIGFGSKEFDSEKVLECSGTAFINSGEKYEQLKKEKLTLAVQSDNKSFDKEMNLYIKLLLVVMNKWTIKTAEIVSLVLKEGQKTQKEMGELLKIKQNAISGRVKRAYLDEIMELNEIYRTKLKELE